jgi:hypothetical protein
MYEIQCTMYIFETLYRTSGEPFNCRTFIFVRFSPLPFQISKDYILNYLYTIDLVENIIFQHSIIE